MLIHPHHNRLIASVHEFGNADLTNRDSFANDFRFVNRLLGSTVK